jgi:hypothetical protein
MFSDVSAIMKISKLNYHDKFKKKICDRNLNGHVSYTCLLKTKLLGNVVMLYLKVLLKSEWLSHISRQQRKK